AEFTGTIEGLTIRTLRLRDINGHLHTMPFSHVNAITNLSRDFGYYLFDLSVSYDDDIDHVMALVKQLGEDMRLDPELGGNVLEPIEIFGLDRFADSAVVIRGRLKTPAGKQSPVGHEFNRRLKKMFEEQGIVMPYRTTTIRFARHRKDKDGKPSSP
ncbi:MAG TPA: mechanosensitive ion channel family protein, partial [Rhodospirillaceae bacterium]|nr:mechanosensitive ion channel family protein [Rhodospirillaceae bacterium]